MSPKLSINRRQPMPVGTKSVLQHVGGLARYRAALVVDAVQDRVADELEAALRHGRARVTADGELGGLCGHLRMVVIDELAAIEVRLHRGLA